MEATPSTLPSKKGLHSNSGHDPLHSSDTLCESHLCRCSSSFAVRGCRNFKLRNLLSLQIQFVIFPVFPLVSLLPGGEDAFSDLPLRTHTRGIFINNTIISCLDSTHSTNWGTQYKRGGERESCELSFSPQWKRRSPFFSNKGISYWPFLRANELHDSLIICSSSPLSLPQPLAFSNWLRSGWQSWKWWTSESL